MTQLNIGDKAPDFTMPADNGANMSLSNYAGQRLVLYFYPKDATPGCTKQACAFRDVMPDFSAMDVAVIGVSKDSVTKHENFIKKQDLNFPLISDAEGVMCDDYGVWKEKSMYGKTFMGIERTTFLIGPDGRIEEIWRKVKVPGHVDMVKQRLSEQSEAA